MRYLLDTHYVLWALTDTKKLSARVKDVITDPGNRVLVSAVSFWEVALKAAVGKLFLVGFSPEDLPEACTRMRFEIVPLGQGESSSYYRLKANYHKDPFDRMLIWQAICHGYVLISADKTVKKYRSEGLQMLPA